MKRLLVCSALALAFPLAAHAYEGYVVADVTLRAGPDVGYPAITLLPAGAPVAIQGCINGWTWCDVIVGPDRGWIAGTYVEEPYGGNRVIVTDYGASIGIPVVTFSLGAYWGHYYAARPWYHDRVRYEHYNWAYRAPPRPAGWTARYHGSWNGGRTGYASNNWHGAVTTPTHRSTYAGYRTTSGNRTTYGGTSAGVRHVAAAPAVQRAPIAHGNRAVASQQGRAHAQQRIPTTRTMSAQARPQPRAQASHARTQQASVSASHGRAVHQANANARRGQNRDHDNEHR